jgi:hypothetical protein|tara:strand:- start:131 stop:496 length:366 start_codon:yes stop_codon:yes gene_type:complete
MRSKIKSETRFISDPEQQDLYDDQECEQFFNKNGEIKVEKKESFFAKIIEKVVGNKPSTCYYIRVHDSTLFDPTGTNSFRVKYLDTKMRRVSKTTFDYYMIYLKTKNSIYLTRAQRSFLDG